MCREPVSSGRPLSGCSDECRRLDLMRLMMMRTGPKKRFPSRPVGVVHLGANLWFVTQNELIIELPREQATEC